MSLTRK